MATDRRTFVAALGGAALLPALPAWAARPTRVVVVGAGLAGLAAAHELESRAIDVTVIEASGRAGGRVKTVRGHFADDTWVDVGATSTGINYGLFKHYCTRHSLTLTTTERGPGRPDVLMHLGGRRLRLSGLREDPSAWPVALTDDEKALAPFRLLSTHLMPIAREIGHASRVLDPAWAHYDDVSLLKFLQRKGASEAAIRLIGHTVNYNSLDSVSTLSALRDMARRLQPSESAHVDGGNDLLPQAMADSLKNPIRFGQELQAVDYDENTARLKVNTKHGSEWLNADRVVLAVPFTALRRVDIRPGLPAPRRKIIEELPYTQIAQTYVQTRDRFFDTDGRISAVYSDSPFERTFNVSDSMSSERGLLLNWINGAGLTPMQGLSGEEHSARVIRFMRSVWPENRDGFERALTTNWAHSYAGGAYAHYAPGQMQRYAALIPQPVGPLHFAGEHTELAAPGMEGALTSGVRAAGEIVMEIENRTNNSGH